MTNESLGTSINRECRNRAHIFYPHRFHDDDRPRSSRLKHLHRTISNRVTSLLFWRKRANSTGNALHRVNLQKTSSSDEGFSLGSLLSPGVPEFAMTTPYLKHLLVHASRRITSRCQSGSWSQRGLFRPSRTHRPQNSSRGIIATSFLFCFSIGVSSRANSKPTAPIVQVAPLKSYPHDPGAFTQGLELDPNHRGQYIESTGHYGQSTLRRVELNSGKVLKRNELSRQHFGEGITRVGQQWVQLTWKSGQALRYDARTLSPLAPWTYKGEGWGLCFNGTTLWMSDGSATLQARDPATFTLLRSIKVRYNDQALSQLNELECAKGKIYANVWHQDWIAEIDPNDGIVTRRIDAASLRKDAGTYAGTLNGIAYRSETGTFLVTGKNWSKIFEVEFAQKAGSSADPGTSPQNPPEKTSTKKRRGCAFFAAKSYAPLGLFTGLYLSCIGLGVRRRRPSTAKRASKIHV